MGDEEVDLSRIAPEAPLLRGRVLAFAARPRVHARRAEVCLVPGRIWPLEGLATASLLVAAVAPTVRSRCIQTKPSTFLSVISAFGGKIAFAPAGDWRDCSNEASVARRKKPLTLILGS